MPIEPDDPRKLYRVIVQVEYFAWADSEDDAEALAEEAVETEMGNDYGKAYATYNPTGNLIPKWDGKALVYHEGSGDISLNDCIAAEKARIAARGEPGIPLIDLLPPDERGSLAMDLPLSGAPQGSPAVPQGLVQRGQAPPGQRGQPPSA